MSSPGRRRRRHQRPWKRSMVATRWNDTSYLPSPYIPAIRSLLPPPPLPFNGARGREQVGKILRVSTSSTELHELSCGVTRYPPPSRLPEPRCQGNWLLRDTLVIPYPAWRACSNFKSSLHRKTSRDTVRKPERWSKENVTVQFRSFFLSSFLFFRFVSKRGHERRVGRVHARHAWLKPREKRPGTEKSVRPRFFSVPLIGKKKKKRKKKLGDSLVTVRGRATIRATIRAQKPLLEFHKPLKVHPRRATLILDRGPKSLWAGYVMQEYCRREFPTCPITNDFPCESTD